MCLLAFIEAGAGPDYDGLETACRRNPDGFGFAVNTGENGFIVYRSMDAKKTVETFERVMNENPDKEALFHARWATHGTKDVSNVHPFWIGKSNTSLLAHNGVLNVSIPKGDNRSDSKVYAEDLFSTKLIRHLDDPEFMEDLGNTIIGSKFVILTNKPAAKRSAYIVNESDGHWKDGTWWSNHSYEEWKPTKYEYVPTGRWDHARKMWIPFDKDGNEKTCTDVAVRDWIPGHRPEPRAMMCEECFSYLIEKDLRMGVCGICHSCLDCHANINDCLCYVPRADEARGARESNLALLRELDEQYDRLERDYKEMMTNA